MSIKSNAHSFSRFVRPLPSPVAALLLVTVFPGPSRAGVDSVVGHYEGAWTNLTFGSTGTAVIDIKVAGNTAALIFDMNGFVFGQFDPPVINMPGAVVGDTVQIDNKGVGFFGDIKGVVDAAAHTLNVVLSNIPGGFIRKVTAIGTVGGGHIGLDYTVDFPGEPSPTNPARGVLGVSVPMPLAIVSLEPQGAQLKLSWRGGQAPYQVQSQTSFSAGEWANLGPVTSDTSVLITAPASGNLFLRVVGR